MDEGECAMTGRPLLRVRCKRCWRVLAEVHEAPGDWSSHLRVPRCRNCDVPSDAHANEVAIERWIAGKGGVQPFGEIPWRDLRSSLESAWSRGKAVDVAVRFVESTVALRGHEPPYPGATRQAPSL